jgi:hypothetical protein
MRIVVNEFISLDGVVQAPGGKRIFPGDGAARPLQLVKTATASTGVVVCTYRPG